MSFPNLPNVKLHEIEKNFYRHFCDLVVESIKAHRISKEELAQKVKLENIELLQQLTQQKSVILISGHIGNWEWLVLQLAEEANFPLYALFKPSSSKKFDNYLKENRSRFGANIIATTAIRKWLLSINKANSAIGFLSDQTPVDVEKSHWMYFMKQVTPVFLGSEKIATQFNLPVVYIHTSKPKRGHYSLRFELITDQPKNLEKGALTEIHTKMLEANINEQPEIWLWTHRRWKRSHLKPTNIQLKPSK